MSSEWDTFRKSLYGDEVRNAVLKAAQVGPTNTVLGVGDRTSFLIESPAKMARKVIALNFFKVMIDNATSKLFIMKFVRCPWLQEQSTNF